MSQGIVIIGAGAVGCLTALNLARRGKRVTLVDKGEVGAESSWAGGGILFPLLPWNYASAVNALALQGATSYPALCEELHRSTGIDPEYTMSGMLVLPPFDGEAAMRWCAEHNFPVEMRDGNLWLPTVGQARNPRLMQALKRALQLAGVEIRDHCPVRLIKQGDVIDVDTSAGNLAAESYVLCAGAWSHDLLGEDSALRGHKPMRGQMLLFSTAPGTLRQIFYREDFYLIPRRDGHVLAGSTVEDAGFDKATTPEAAADLHRKATSLLPALAEAPVVKHWSGLRPGSPHNVPVIARHPSFGNLWLNTGHFRYGVTMAPASAQILADLMDGKSSGSENDYKYPS